jgi:hypothetical protein
MSGYRLVLLTISDFVATQECPDEVIDQLGGLLLDGGDQRGQAIGHGLLDLLRRSVQGQDQLPHNRPHLGF